MSRQSAPMNLRDRQIREALDEDLRYYRQVLDREFKQARLMNETYAPPNQQEKQVAFQIDRYFTKFQQEADMLTNALVYEQNEDPSALIAAYQELIGYLEVYARYGTLNQRDISVIENKFDAIAPQIEQITTVATYFRWRQAPILAQLSGLLQDRHYIKLRKSAERLASVEVAEAYEVPRPRQPPPPRQDDQPPPPQPPASGDRSVKREAKPEPGSAPASPATPKYRKDLQTEIDKIPEDEFNSLLKDLGLYDGLVAKRGSSTKSLKKVANKPQLQLVFDYKTTGVNPTVFPQASASAPLMEYGDPANVLPPVPEIQPDMSGEGRRRQLGIMCGSGESEDMMYGRPAGLKKALHLRPMDRQPVRFKTADERGEAGLSLENRMMFLNQLDSKPVKDELEINSTSSYKKAMAEKAKKMAKMKGKEF
jgi:hypothetical protein